MSLHKKTDTVKDLPLHNTCQSKHLNMKTNIRNKRKWQFETKEHCKHCHDI